MFKICKPVFGSALHGLFSHSRPVSSSQERDIDGLSNMDVRGCGRLIKWNQFLIDPFLLRSQFFLCFYQRRVAGFGGCPRWLFWRVASGQPATAVVRELSHRVHSSPSAGCSAAACVCECWSERGAATINKKLSATHLLLRLAKSIRRKDCLYLSPTHLSQNASLWSAQIPKQNFTINLSAFQVHKFA